MSEHFNWVMGALLPYINFALFLAMAVYFFRKPLNGMAAKRRQDYESMFAEAKRIKEQAEQQSRDLDQRLKSLNDEIKQITDNARRTAEVEKQATINAARALAEHITTEAARIADAELQNAVRDLRKTIVGQITETVTEKFKKEIDKEAQSTLIDKRVDKLQSLGLGKVH